MKKKKSQPPTKKAKKGLILVARIKPQIKPKPKRRKVMDEHTPPSPRGAGSGEAAVAARSVIDPPVEQPTRTETVDALEAERDKQAAYNAEMADMQIEAANKFNEKMVEHAEQENDPDKAREDAKAAAEAANDPKAKEAGIKAQQKFRADRDKAAAQK